MYLTQCACCAAPLGLSLGKKCGRCSTRYCGPECQVQHWKEGGHDQLCKKIKKAGGAEQYNANQKYAEAFAVAVEKCADDTKGQTCFICTQALHWKTKEGLVRGCACRGTAGFAHVSCLVEQAKILVAEAEENNLGNKMLCEKWTRWHTCSLCEQEYHSVVRCALGWACWKTYLGRPEADRILCWAMNQLGNGLGAVGHHADALPVQEAELSMLRRVGASHAHVLTVQNNIASSYHRLGRLEESLSIRRDIYSEWLRFFPKGNRETLRAATNYAACLNALQRFEQAKKLLREVIPVAQRLVGDTDGVTLTLRANYAEALYANDDATLDDLREAVTTLEDIERIARRVFGGAHPLVVQFEAALRLAREILRACETLRGA